MSSKFLRLLYIEIALFKLHNTWVGWGPSIKAWRWWYIHSIQFSVSSSSLHLYIWSCICNRYDIQAGGRILKTHHQDFILNVEAVKSPNSIWKSKSFLHFFIFIKGKFTNVNYSQYEMKKRKKRKRKKKITQNQSYILFS